MNPVWRRVIFALAVLVWAGVMIYFYHSGRIIKYLAPDFRPITLAGGLGLAVLGLFNLLTARQVAACGHDHGEEDGHSAHDHEATDLNPWLAALLMILPVSFAAAWTKDQYSQATLARKGLYDEPSMASSPFLQSLMPELTLESIERTHRRTEDGFLQLSLLELFFAAGDSQLMKLFDGLEVETEGRIIEERVRNEAGTRMRLYRMFMTCCVADSRAIPIVLEFGHKPPQLPENGWVRVAGKMSYPEEGGLVQPVLFVERATAAEAPAEEKFLRNQ